MTTNQNALDGDLAGKRAGLALMGTIVLTAAIVLLLGEAAYPWLKALHVVAIISWMAGLLYLPRLFIYHCDTAPGSAQSETFKVMEHRLLKVIMTPAMLVSWVLGLWLAYQGGHLAAPWFLAKLALVVALSGAHGYLAGAVRRFGLDQNDTPARTWRMINEVPTVLMILIVVLVVVKPF
jgi:protoporphyrinogen IX oxidase